MNHLPKSDRLMPKLLRHVLIIVAYFVIALLIVGHVPTILFNHFIGSQTGDSYEMARNVWWFGFALRNGQEIFYQSWLGYPNGIDGAVLMSVPLQYFPMWALAMVLPLPIAYNLVVLLWMALNGWSMYWLVKSLAPSLAQQTAEERKTSDAPALLAGLVYMAFPTFQTHLAEGHAGLIVAWAAPLYLWALFRYTEAKTGVWRWLVAAVLFFYLSTTGHILQSIFVLLPITAAFGLGKLWQRDWLAIGRIFGMGLLASGVLLVALYPAIRSATTESAYGDIQGYVRYSADLLALFSPSFLHPIFDSILAYPRRVLGTNLAEGAAYIGLIATVLVILGLVKKREARWWLLLAGLAWILSLGPVLKLFDQPVLINGATIPLPFALVQNLPAFNLARTPARFNFTLALALAVMVGYGTQWLWERLGKGHYLLMILLAAGILWEYQSFWPMPLLPAAIPQAVVDLREEAGLRAVFDIPYDHALAAKDGLYLQTGHELPLLAGQITRTTPVNPAMLAILQETLDPALLQDVGVDIVILHRQRAGNNAEALANRANQKLGAPIYEDASITIYRVPQVEAIELNYAFDERETLFADGITLTGAKPFVWENKIYVWLRWYFAAPRVETDIRFVHILDAHGDIVLQSDIAFGVIGAGEQGAELVPFDASGLEAGYYTVRVGWYDFNTMRNYLLLDGQAALEIGEIEIENE
jgi:hypothetical protein